MDSNYTWRVDFTLLKRNNTEQGINRDDEDAARPARWWLVKGLFVQRVVVVGFLVWRFKVICANGMKKDSALFWTRLRLCFREFADFSTCGQFTQPRNWQRSQNKKVPWGVFIRVSQPALWPYVWSGQQETMHQELSQKLFLLIWHVGTDDLDCVIICPLLYLTIWPARSTVKDRTSWHG